MDMFWLMVTVAVTGGLAIPLSVIWSTHRQKLAKLQAADSAGEVAMLKDRIQVLERIATDQGVVTAAQIEALRDTPRADEFDAGVPLGLEKREKA